MNKRRLTITEGVALAVDTSVHLGDRLYFCRSEQANLYLTNMQPQIQGHNGGVWGKLEEKVRAWAGQCDTLYNREGCHY